MTMERYNYYEAVADDVREYINNEINLDEWRGDRDGLEQHLNDELWTVDSVTGNASGSYTFNTYTAEEYICHNLDLLNEAIGEFGGNPATALKSPESADVTIRCYVLGSAISEVLDELESEGAFEEPDEDEDETDETDE